MDNLTGAVHAFPRERFLNFVKMLRIRSKDVGLIPLRFNGAQLYILDELCRGLEDGVTTFLFLKARQLGASTFFLALDLFWAFEYKGLVGAFVTHDEASRDQFRDQITLNLNMLPDGYKKNIMINNRTLLTFENASMFRYLVAGTKQSGSSKLGRSGGCNYCHSSETAFYGNVDDLASLQQTFSDKYGHRLYVFESTANGFNHFQEMWETALSSPAQRAVFVGWWRNEAFEFSSEHPLYIKYMPQGTKTPMTELEAKKVRQVKKLYGFDITSGQLAWYRYMLENKCNGDQAMADQEVPWTADDAFVSTGSQFFTDSSITYQSKEAKQKLCKPFLFKMTEHWDELEVVPSRVGNASLKVWEEPVHNGVYVMGVDPAYGSSPEADQTVLSIFRCYSDRLEQVAEYCSNSIQTYQCAWVLAFLGGWYQDIMVNLELNGPGTAVFNELKVLKNQTRDLQGLSDKSLYNCMARMRDFRFLRPDSMMGGSTIRHWRTNMDNKRAMFHRMKDFLELGLVRIRSMHCLEEMRRIEIDEGFIAAGGRSKDDRPFAAGLAIWAWDQWRRNEMKNKGITYERAKALEASGGVEDPVQSIMTRFLKDKKIIMNKDEILEKRQVNYAED